MLPFFTPLVQTLEYQEFAEPFVVDNNTQTLHAHAASLKPVYKQLASGSHYASRRELPCVAGRTTRHSGPPRGKWCL